MIALMGNTEMSQVRAIKTGLWLDKRFALLTKSIISGYCITSFRSNIPALMIIRN